jgi:hypothetical protein
MESALASSSSLSLSSSSWLIKCQKKEEQCKRQKVSIGKRKLYMTREGESCHSFVRSFICSLVVVKKKENDNGEAKK